MLQHRISRGEILLAAAVALTPSVGIALLVMRQPTPALDLTTGRALVAMAFEIAAVLATGSILRRRGADPGSRLRDFSRQSALAGLSLFFAWVILYFGTALVSAILFPGFPSARPFRMLTTAPAAVILLLTVVSALFEEVVVVGYAVSALSADGAAISVGVSTLLRFVCHLYQGPLAAVSVIPVGLLVAAVYWRSRNIGPLIVAHALASILAFALAGARSV